MYLSVTIPSLLYYRHILIVIIVEFVMLLPRIRILIYLHVDTTTRMARQHPLGLILNNHAEGLCLNSAYHQHFGICLAIIRQFTHIGPTEAANLVST